MSKFEEERSHFDSRADLWWYLFDYCNGELLWNVNRGTRKMKGKPAGTGACDHGYWSIQVSGASFHRSRIVYEMHYGDISDKMQIDHIDRDNTNDRIENLRVCSTAENCRNQGARRSNTSGYKGVSWFKDKSVWFAQLMVDGKQKYLGSFTTPEEAAAAYDEAAKIHHGNFAVFNFPELQEGATC